MVGPRHQRLEELARDGHRRPRTGSVSDPPTAEAAAGDEEADPQETALAVLAVVAVVTDMLSNSAAVRGAHKLSTAIAARLETIVKHLKTLRNQSAGRGTDICFGGWVDGCLEVWERWGFLTPALRALFRNGNQSVA